MGTRQRYCEGGSSVSHPLNRYQNYKEETSHDAYEYEKRRHDEEDAYRRRLNEEIERDLYREYDR